MPAEKRRRWTYLESEDFWLDEVDGRAIDSEEAFAGFAVGYCGGSLCVSNELFVREILSSCQRFALLQPWSETLSVT